MEPKKCPGRDQEHPEGAGESVFGAAELACLVGDLGLADPGRIGHPGDPDRDEPMHLPEQSQLPDHLGPIDLETAAVVVECDPRDLPDEQVGDARGNLAHQKIVLTLTPPALEQVQVPRDQLIHHARNVRGVVLQVPVQGRDELAPCRIEARLHGGRLSEIAAQPDHARVPAVAPCHLGEALAGAVPAAVVHADQLPATGVIRKSPVDPSHQGLHVVDLVVHRDHDRERGSRCAVAGLCTGHPKGSCIQGWGLTGARSKELARGGRWRGAREPRGHADPVRFPSGRGIARRVRRRSATEKGARRASRLSRRERIGCRDGI